MDALDMLRLAEDKGGRERRDAIQQLLLFARGLRCSHSTAGGKAGGFNIRYGSLSYSLMDVTTEGTVFLHINPDSGALSDEIRQSRNAFIADLEGITVKSGTIQNYGQIEEAIETVPTESWQKFLAYTVEHIRDTYYRR